MLVQRHTGTGVSGPPEHEDRNAGLGAAQLRQRRRLRNHGRPGQRRPPGGGDGGGHGADDGVWPPASGA